MQSSANNTTSRVSNSLSNDSHSYISEYYIDVTVSLNKITFKSNENMFPTSLKIKKYFIISRDQKDPAVTCRRQSHLSPDETIVHWGTI